MTYTTAIRFSLEACHAGNSIRLFGLLRVFPKGVVLC